MRHVAALAAGLLLAAPMAARAQGFDFTASGSGAVEITSDQGLELSQEQHSVTARGHAKAVRGGVTVTADELVAYYRPRAGATPATASAATADQGGPGGDSEIWKVVADGGVTIASPTATAIGDHAEYTIDDQVVRLTGKDLRLTTQSEIVTARDALEYWEAKQQAVARDLAVIVTGPRRLQADTITADFTQDAAGALKLADADAINHVILTAPGEIVTGDRGRYVAESGIVTVTGSVKMTRDRNQLDGGYAIVNLNTGISRLLPAPPGSTAGETQVKGLLTPSAGASSPGSQRPPAPGAGH